MIKQTKNRKSIGMTFSSTRTVSWSIAVVMLAGIWTGANLQLAQAQDDPPARQAPDSSKAKQADELPLVPSVLSTEAGEAKDEREEAAWEYRPYQVLVWVIHDHGARLNPVNPRLVSEVSRHCQLADSSGWDVTVQNAPQPWNGRLLTCDDFEPWTRHIILSAKTIAGNRLDKLIVVRLSEQFGMIGTEVQELDLKTGLWGARIDQTCDITHLEPVVFDGIRKAFMPLTRIDHISGRDVLARVRALGISWVAETADDGRMSMVPNVGSPVWVGDHEILLPVILRKDRLGNISKIQPVEHTFLTIVERTGPHLQCDTIAMQRAPLGGRSGGRTERMALCVRGPDRGTTLSLISNEKVPEPLRDLEVYSQTEAGEASEFLGKSDWQGKIKIPPGKDGIRVLLVKSGQRPLAQVPVVPGLYASLTARMPNDERRLYAEGIVKGYQNELFDLLARRLILATIIESALEKSDLPTAESRLAELRKVEDSKRFNGRLNAEKKGLLNADERQKGFINAMFDELEGLSNIHLDSQVVAELSRKVRDTQKAEKGDVEPVTSKIIDDADIETDAEGSDPPSE